MHNLADAYTPNLVCVAPCTMTNNTLAPQHLVIYDGVCNLCSKSVQFILTRNGKRNIIFTAAQGAYAHHVLAQYGMQPAVLNSVVYINNGKVYKQSAAVLHICKQLSGLWPLMYAFIIVPPIIRNAVYNYIAKHRYKWYGSTQVCWLPKPEWQQRFVS